MSQIFVSREVELNKLNSFLTEMLNGKTQVCFISGEPGTGKSRLIEEFILRSKNCHENLIFTTSQCNAQTGISTPYIVFKTILGQLMGGETTNTSTENNTEGWSKMVKTSGRLLVDIAPDLIGTVFTIIPGMNILAGIARFTAQEQGWLKILEDKVKAYKNQPTEIEQSQIFLQYTAFLRHLSEKLPLVIIIDDLQWVDEASNALFFHLARELKNCRIFLVGLYRPNDVKNGRNNERHPLESTLNELKRLYGDVWLDLDETTKRDGKAFVDALIDTYPNKLGDGFRQTLLQWTGGNALFTRELLRSMYERGNLIQDNEGYWQESDNLDWNQLPKEIEGIIEERIGRLSDELREILDIACVEGQYFTVEILAKIKDLKEQDLVKKLDHELERRHHLVEESNEIQLKNNTFLSRYSFIHVLFQNYLYDCLSKKLKRIFHREIAEMLESFYGEQSELIPVQLAYHYKEAGQNEKALTYLQLAGEQAFNLAELNQARKFFNQALEIISNSNETTMNHGKLEWWIGQTYYYQGLYSDCETHYRVSLEIARLLEDEQTITQGLISLADSLRRQYKYADAMTFAQEAISLADKNNNLIHKTRALRVMGIIYGGMNRNDARLNYYKQALQIANEINDEVEQMACLNNMGVIYGSVLGNYPQAIEYYKQALELSRTHNRLVGQRIYYNNLASTYRKIGNYQKSQFYSEKYLEIANKFSHVLSTGSYYTDSAINLLHTDPANIYQAIELWLKSIRMADEYQRINEQINRRNWLLIAYLITNQLDQAIIVIEETKPLLAKQAQATKVRICNEITLEAITYLRLRHLDKANSLFQEAKKIAQKNLNLNSERWAYHYHQAFAQAGIALLAKPNLRYNALTEATQYFEDAINNCGWLGILNDVLIVLREMRKADPENILQPLEREIINKREIAWNNIPSID